MLGDDVALHSAHFIVRIRPPGAATITLHGRDSSVPQKIVGKWLRVHAHTLLQTSSKSAMRNLLFDQHRFLFGKLHRKRFQTSNHVEGLVQPVEKIRLVLPRGRGRRKPNKVGSCKGKAA